MAIGVQVVVVCEDILHETFVRAFLINVGFDRRKMTFRKAPAGEGDAKQFVCKELPREVQKTIRKYPHERRAVIYVIDADRLTTGARRQRVAQAFDAQGVSAPASEEPVFGFIPKWEIENWLAYLRQEDVDEESCGYDKYTGRESHVYPLVRRLADMCARQQLPNAPPSLVEACTSYATLKAWLRS